MGTLVYTVDGALLGLIEPGTVNSTLTSFDLAATGHPNFTTLFNETLIRLASNFAGETEPRAPLLGQLWFDRRNGCLRVRSSDGWSNAATILTGGHEFRVEGAVQGSIALTPDGLTGSLKLETITEQGIYTKASVSAAGLVEAGSHIMAADVIDALGYEPRQEDGQPSLPPNSAIWWSAYEPVPVGYVVRTDLTPPDECLIPISPA